MEFIQPAAMWALYYYQHDNVVTLNAHTFPVSPGSVAVIPPGARVAHAKIGGDTPYAYMSFDMPGKGNVRAVMPHKIDGMERYFQDWLNCSARSLDTILYLQAFAWNFMCSNSENLALHRSDAILYEAEAWILANLDKKISVSALSHELKVSQRQLLRIFREQHDLTVQDYIIRRRIREAGRLLVTTDMQPKEIAAKVGIYDLQHFNKLMRVHTGVSPRNFRRAYESQRVTLR